MIEHSETAVLQNLKDAGCSQETIDRFMDCFKQGMVNDQLQILSQHRKALLEEMHREQKRIDCLDYLVYKLKKTQVAG